ncbi:MAG: hypothetical protein ACREOI_19390 [bacterium]
MKNLLTILVLLLASTIRPLPVFGQNEISLRIKGGWNTYAMTDLKALQIEARTTLRQDQVRARITEYFPPYLSLQGALIFSVYQSHWGSVNVGGFPESLSTGGRVHYQDYSGEVRFDQVISGISLGGLCEFELKQSKKFSWRFAAELSVISSSLENEPLLRIGQNTVSEKIIFNSLAIAFQPRLAPTIKLGSMLWGLHLGYQFSAPATLKWSEDSRGYLVNANNQKVKSDWSGLRTGIWIGYNFNKHKKPNK